MTPPGGSAGRFGPGRDLRFRERFGAVVVAIQRGQELLEDELAGEIITTMKQIGYPVEG